MRKKKKITREPREESNSNIDFNVPVTLEMFGTENDPCFGKHYEPNTDECSACGDFENCIIAMAQNSHVKRKNIELKNNFKDIEEEVNQNIIDKAMLEVEIVSFMEEYDKPVPLITVCKYVKKIFDKRNLIEKKDIITLVKSQVNVSDRLTLITIKDKKYIKLK